MRRTGLWVGLIVGLVLAVGCAWGEETPGLKELAGLGESTAPVVVGTLPCDLLLGPSPIEKVPSAAPAGTASAAAVLTTAAAEGEETGEPSLVPYLVTVFAPRPSGPYRERVVKAVQFTKRDLEAVRSAADPAAALAAHLGLRHEADDSPNGAEIPERQMLLNLLLKMQQPRALVSFDRTNEAQGSVSLGNDRTLRETMGRDWQGVAGFVRDQEGEAVGEVEVRLRAGAPESEQVFKTTPTGYFEFTSAALEGLLLVEDKQYPLKWGAGQRQFVNVTVVVPTTSRGHDEAGMVGALGIGEPDTASIVDTWADLGGLPSPLTRALQMMARKLPVMGGVTYSSRSGMRAYYGLEQQLGADVFDRGPRVAAYGDLVVEVVEYAPEWEVSVSSRDAAAALEEAKDILAEAEQDESSVRYLIQFTRTKRQGIVDQTPPTEEGVEQVKALTEEIEALSARLPYLQQRRRTAQAQQAYYGALSRQADANELTSYQLAGTEVARRKEALGKAQTALAAALEQSGADGLPGLSEPDLAQELAAKPEETPELLGNASMRSLRLTVATQLAPEALDFAKRRQAGPFGLTAGISVGSDGTSDSTQAAYGAWYRLTRSFDLKLMVGRTIDADNYEAEFLGGLMFSLPMGKTRE